MTRRTRVALAKNLGAVLVFVVLDRFILVDR